MKPGWTHRLRRHTISELDRHIAYNSWWEGGRRIDHVMSCSCGHSWVRHTSPSGKVWWR